VREEFHSQLEAIRGALADMASLSAEAIDSATVSLLDADLDAADAVAKLDSQLEVARRATEAQTYDLLALQQPVAVDLRALVMAIKVGADIDRMGSLANHVAKVARRRHPAVAIPEQLIPVFRRMGDSAQRMAQSAAAVLASQDAADAGRLAVDDDAMDGLRRSLFRTLLDEWPYGVEAAIDVALLGRYYERFADHAVSIADAVVYLVTGALPEERAEPLG
jgi:phosphate transport system protein